jgi:hypothetical protein
MVPLMVPTSAAIAQQRLIYEFSSPFILAIQAPFPALQQEKSSFPAEAAKRNSYSQDALNNASLLRFSCIFV